MGAITSREIYCCNKKYIKDHEIDLDKTFTTPKSLSKIILIQSKFRSFLFRKKKDNIDGIKTISLEYNMDSYEQNPLITRLEKLLPKFEFNEGEENYIKHCPYKLKGFLYPNKYIYKGMINYRGLREGYGKLYFPDGTIYKGFFRNNKMEGRGRLLSINGYIYEGDFKNNLSNGYGKYVSLDGTSYTGNWKDDKQSGIGDIIYPDGSRFRR